MSSYVTIAPDGSRTVDVQSLFYDQIELVRRIARMEQKLYGACERCGANIAAGHYAHCPHYVTQKRDLTELNKRLRALGGKVDCNDVQDELHAAQQRITALEAERDDYRERWEQTGCTRHTAMETAIKLAESYRQQLDDMVAERDRLAALICTCPTQCDCEAPDHGLCSQECPDHNYSPRPSMTCPVHGETETSVKEYAYDSVADLLEPHMDREGRENGFLPSSVTEAVSVLLDLVLGARDEQDRLIDELRDAEARNAQKLSEIERLREALAAAQTLSEIYFSIAEQFVDGDTIRQRRDVQIARAALESGDE